MPRVATALLALCAAAHWVAPARSESDVSALLQGSVEKKRMEDIPMVKETAPELLASEHAELLKCDGKDESIASVAPALDERSPRQEAPVLGGAAPTEADSAEKTAYDPQDPPGAATLKLVLQLAVIGLFADAIRRLRQQQKEKAQAIASTDENEKITYEAWNKMVAAAADADVPRFERSLLGEKAPITRADPWGCTPLHFAAKGGSAAIVAELLKRGAEVEAVDAMDETPLHFAARAGHVEACEVLLAKGAAKDATNVQDMTPLVVAGVAKQASTVRFFLEKGAGVAGMTDEALPLMVVNEMVKRVLFPGGA